MPALSYLDPRRIKFGKGTTSVVPHESPEAAASAAEVRLAAFRNLVKPQPLGRRSSPVMAYFLALMLLATLLVSCGGSSPAPAPAPPSATPTPLTSAEVQQVVQDAVQSADAPLVVAVADRTGKILAVFRNPTAPLTST